MNFYMSKENIQPLRGGRNVGQLGLALQAESGAEEFRRELNQQRELFINAIKNDQGDDPLDNWYKYITWIEQSYPKNGHEGNLIPLLEECLKKFEHDERYVNDVRFCKLWIKFIDMQNNPIELYQMMYAKGICIGCADLYKAWAYYHEAVDDFKSADAVFENGMKQLAQPYDELKMARDNLIVAAGSHMLYGTDQRKLMEKRQALTSLASFKSGRVGSVRVSGRPGVPTLPSSSNISQKLNNAPLLVYESTDNEEHQGAVAVPNSILVAVKRNEAPKENTLKPGPWNSAAFGKKKVIQHNRHTPAFQVHEDDAPPINFPSATKETYRDWFVSLTIPEVYDSKWLPQYPKARVYVDKTTEYSLEELRAVRYRQKKRQIQEQHFSEEVINQFTPPLVETSAPQSTFQISQHNSFVAMETNQCINVPVSFEVYNSPGAIQPQEALAPVRVSNQIGGAISNIPNLMVVESVPVINNDISFSQLVYGNMAQASPPKKAANFVAFEQSDLQADVQPKGSAMKTPFRDLNAEDLAETGSQGSRDVPMAAQPIQSAVIEIDDDSDSELLFGKNCEMLLNNSFNTQQFNFNLAAMKVSTPQPKLPGIQNNCFQMKRESDAAKPTRKLFVFEDNRDEQVINNMPSSARKANAAPGELSVIEEESKTSYGSSSNGSNANTKSILSNTRPTGGLETISEEHKSYLSQNLMANDALRRSLLGDLLPAGAPPAVEDSNDVDMHSNPESRSSSPLPGEYPISETVPSNPFKSTEIAKLLNLVKFPGAHSKGLHYVSSIPYKMFVKKDTILLGNTQYIFDKILGKGTFGKVYKALDVRKGEEVALKFQKPTNKWEFYICRELQARLGNQSLKDRFMNITNAYFSDQTSVLVYDYKPLGSLLDLANQVKRKTGKHMQECLVFYFSIEMLTIIEALHSAKIIHADIKPDNFLVQLSPDNINLELQLIDFGCSIDMSLYPPNASFTKQVTTENFICCEMKEGKPWNYHTDLFCIAASTHVLLFDKYLEVQRQFDAWTIKEKLPRYMNRDVWTKFFNILLNQQKEAKVLQTELDNALSHVYEKFASGMKNLVNLVKNR